MVRINSNIKLLKPANLPNSEVEARRFGHPKVTKLNYNENNYGPSPLLAKILPTIFQPEKYPEYRDPDLIDKLARRYELRPHNFYVSNGSDAIIDMIPLLFTDESSDEIILPALTYNRLATTAMLRGVKVVPIELKNGAINLNAMLSAINAKTRVIYLVNPNMPTGVGVTFDEIAAFMKSVPSDVLVVLDEAYIEFARGIQQAVFNDRKLIERFDNILITHTFSKLYALAAFRIGYFIAAPYIVDAFARGAQYLPVSTFALRAASACLDDEAYYSGIISKFNLEKERYYDFFRQENIDFYKSQTNFIYLLVAAPEKISEYLLAHYALLIRPIRQLGLRIAVGLTTENDKVMRALGEIKQKFPSWLKA